VEKKKKTMFELDLCYPKKSTVEVVTAFLRTLPNDVLDKPVCVDGYGRDDAVWAGVITEELIKRPDGDRVPFQWRCVGEVNILIDEDIPESWPEKRAPLTGRDLLNRLSLIEKKSTVITGYYFDSIRYIRRAYAKNPHAESGSYEWLDTILPKTIPGQLIIQLDVGCA
jgi:hypothetical protein